ncbi:dienelactone hydrolase family protein [Streptomyces sp. NPDC057682]|uniref:dienelactone hydrolase family protein n=1 Tax=Streptomyces sp. NPDC057682 TaxID=3346210 RepID=UPI0036A7304D
MPDTTLLVPTPDGPADAFAAFPEGGGPHPGVLMYPDAFGIRPALRAMARELAGHGYVVLVPNVFHRQGPTPVVELPDFIGEDDRPGLVARLMPFIEAHTPERTLADAGAFLSFLSARPEVAPGPVAVSGYCFGGLLAVRTAAAHPGTVAALASFHGPVHADGLDVLSGLRAEIHFGHAAGDLTPQALAGVNAALDTAGIAYTSEIYPGTVHGFTMPDTDAFDAGASGHHWDRLLALLGSALPAG